MNMDTWTASDGTVTEISKLTDSHLKNIIAYIERNCERIADMDQWAMVNFEGSDEPLLMDPDGEEEIL